MTAQQVRDGLLLMARDKSGVRVRKADGAFVRVNAPSRDLSLIEWIKQGGGIWDGAGGEFKGGDFAAMGLNDWYKGGPFRDKKTIIRTAEQGHGNRGADNVLRAAVEAGYFPELRAALDGAGSDQLDTNVLLQAVDTELRGHATRYPIGSRSYERTAQLDETRPADVAPRGDNPYSNDAMLSDTYDDLRMVADSLGIDPAMIDQDMVFYAADLRHADPELARDPHNLFSRAINDIADATRWEIVDATGKSEYEDLDYAWPHTSENPAPDGEAGAAAADGGGQGRAGAAAGEGGAQRGDAGGAGEPEPPALADMPREETARFIDPTGEAAKAQIDALEHDARMAANGGLDNGAAVDPNIAAKTRQELDLAAQQRLDGSRKTGKAQDPVMPEGLFGGPIEATFDLGDGGPPKTMADILKALDEDDAANATIRDCMVPRPGEGA